jgi:phosphoribosylaminoimidazolecarboxamide formyltransferase/IMP cyclohydrolase
MASIDEKGIRPIDLIVINLYPFEATVARPGCTFEEAIEKIDIGGPSMVRSASKNHASVAVLTDPADYAAVLDEMTSGGVTDETRLRLAIKAFAMTSRYDRSIARYLGGQAGHDSPEPALPEALEIELTRVSELRYGENPHQKGAFYRNPGPPVGLAAMQQLSGKELSYLNMFDVNGALELVWEFTGQPAAVVVKHASPCGVALGQSITEAYRRALKADPVSAFGGIIALNAPLDDELAHFMVEEGTFLEVVAAPAVSPAAAELLKARKKNLRVLVAPYPGPAVDGDRRILRSVRGGVLAQEPDEGLLDLSNARCVTERQPTPEELEQLAFAWKVVKHVKSNAIAICRNFQTVGIGGGQTDRWRASRAAVANAGDRAKGAVLASDAFFPFPDGPEEAARAGVVAIVQPGGSLRDQTVIDIANQYHMAMIMTGARHFRH